MGSKLYAGNLPFEATAEDLTSAFEDYGDVVESALEKDKETDQSRGYGFVTMNSPQEAAAAISGLNGQE
ncbi:hypothetical protein AnigIFM60653_009087 [Aspergillus niger]|nr:hypothetical protein AnigIFM50267_011205 [Aspergillus niger]GLA07848.1 hypothetical protein AnigIFM60653_009087 [Aspergillus niger]